MGLSCRCELQFVLWIWLNERGIWSYLRICDFFQQFAQDHLLGEVFGYEYIRLIGRQHKPKLADQNS